MVVLCGAGRNFCAGIDTGFLFETMGQLNEQSCPGRLREKFRDFCLYMQDANTAIERFKWPVIAAVHGSCIGQGIDCITACDIRVCRCVAPTSYRCACT